MVERDAKLPVTDAREYAEAIRAREEDFRQMLASAVEPVVIFDPASRVCFANTAAHAVFGYAPDEMLGLPLDALVPTDMHAMHAGFVQSFRAAPSARAMATDLPLQARRKDGSLFPVEVALAVMHTLDGLHTVAFVTDISRRREEESRARAYHARLREMAFEIQVSEEREQRRIAVGLHDQIGQSLTLVNMRLTRLRDRLAGDDLALVTECLQLLEHSVDDVRTLIFDLSPPILYDLGLVAAIEWLAEQVQARYGLRVTVDGESLGEIDPDIAAVIFRAVRELLANIAKHAGTGEARVRLHAVDDRVVVVVEDQGAGFAMTPSGPPGRGFGLLSVREQFGRLHGAVEVTSSPGAGTRVRLEVPATRRGSSPPEEPLS